MNGDSTTRLLLAGILLALIVSIVRGFGAEAPVASAPVASVASAPVASVSPGSSDHPGWGRYQITSIRAGSPMLLRTDSVTGRVWKLELRGGSGVWDLFEEPKTGAPEAAGWGRYQVIGTKAGVAMLIRLDTVTGRVWQFELRGGAGVWHPFEEPLEGGAEGSAPVSGKDPAPAPEKPAPAPTDGGPVGSTLPAPPTSVEEELDSYVQAASREQLPPDIRIWGIGKLADIEDPKATEALIQAVAASDARVALAAIEALDGRDDDRIDAALKAAATHPDASVQRAAAERLGGE